LDRVLSFDFESGGIGRLRQARGAGNRRCRWTFSGAWQRGESVRGGTHEFDSVERAVAAHDGEGYQAALKVFNKAADRDLRIVEGLA
jgi:hypothetical protein